MKFFLVSMVQNLPPSIIQIISYDEVHKIVYFIHVLSESHLTDNENNLGRIYHAIRF
jgi:hypothetical protein